MDLFDILRVFIGMPQRRDTVLDDSSKGNQNYGIYNVGGFYNDGSLDEHFHMLQQMMQQFQTQEEQNFHIFESTQPTFESQEAESNIKPSVRDQMLKPEMGEKSHPAPINSDSSQFKLPVWRDDRMYYSTR